MHISTVKRYNNISLKVPYVIIIIFKFIMPCYNIFALQHKLLIYVYVQCMRVLALYNHIITYREPILYTCVSIRVKLYIRKIKQHCYDTVLIKYVKVTTNIIHVVLMHFSITVLLGWHCTFIIFITYHYHYYYYC